MKIKLSKNQWEKMGKEAGWIQKQAQNVQVPQQVTQTNQTQQVQPNTPVQQAPVQQAPVQQNQPVQNQQQPQQSQQQKQQDSSKWTFQRLLQDANFQNTFNTLKQLKENEKKILQYWNSMGIQYQSIPEIAEIIGK